MKATGKFKSASEGAFQRTFQHIGAKDAWSLQLLFFFLYTVSVISFLTDSVYLQSFDPTWFFVSAAACVPPIAIAVCYKVFYLKRAPEKNRPVLNLVIAALAGASRNLSVGLFALWTNLDLSQIWVFRFFGGIILGLGIFTIWALSQGTTSAYRSALRSLASLQSNLAATREEIPEILQEINERLQNRTRSAVLPQLELITKALGETRSGEVAIEHLRQTLENEIRPLLNSIANDAPEPFQERNIESLQKIKSSLPSKFKLYPALPVVSASVTQSIGYGFWLAFLYGPKGLVDSAIAILVYGFSLLAFKQLIPRNMEFSKGAATIIIFLASAAASLLTAVYLSTLNLPGLTFWVLAGVSVFSGILAPVILAHSSVRVARQNEIERGISRELRALAKENSLFAQKVWVFRKRWLLLLHGTVQSALTAAVARLQSAKDIDEFTVQMVNQDLKRAEQALNSEATAELNFELSIAELKNVWRGICDVRIEVSERAKRALLRNYDSAFCLNEIAKEAVSNAVRHGAAKSANIKIDRIEDDLLQVEIHNDGIAPRSKENPGIGSNMLDEICLRWSLSGKSKQVLLYAELPVRV